MRISGIGFGVRFASGTGPSRYSLEGPPILECPAAKRDIVLLASGKVSKRKWKFVICNDAQIRLDPALQKHAGFGVSLG